MVIVAQMNKIILRIQNLRCTYIWKIPC